MTAVHAELRFRRENLLAVRADVFYGSATVEAEPGLDRVFLVAM